MMFKIKIFKIKMFKIKIFKIKMMVPMICSNEGGYHQ